MPRIRSIKSAGITKTTVDEIRIIRRAHRLDKEATEKIGRPTFVTVETAPVKQSIEKPLYSVVDEDGTVREMTKRQAKRAYSPRQVRRALKRSRRA